MSKKKNVLVVMGGNSNERSISLNSGYACLKAIKKLGYNTKIFDPKKNFFNNLKKNKVDVIFNALHGKDGEDGVVQCFFEYLKIPYTHSGVISSMNCMDKSISKKIFLKKKILSPKYFELYKKDLKSSKLINLIKKNHLSFPLVIKPINEGSSIGVKICKNIVQFKNESKKLLSKYEPLLVEKFIDGQEIQVAVLNNKALGAIELKPKREFYDYKAKYFKSAKTNHIMPANLNKTMYRRVLRIAQKVHKIFNCRGVTRSDFKFYKGKFYLLEINTQPGMTNLSLVHEIANFVNIDFKSLVRKLILDAGINK